MAPVLDESRWTSFAGDSVQVKYTEMVKDGSPSFTVENDGTKLTRKLLVRWDDLSDARVAFLGRPRVVMGEGGIPYLSRQTPDPSKLFFNSDSNKYLFATGFSGLGHGNPGDAASAGVKNQSQDSPRYRYAQLDVLYESLTYDIYTDEEMVIAGLTDEFGNPDESTISRYVSAEVAPGVEYLTLPIGGFVYVGPMDTASPSKPAVVLGGPGKLVPNYDFTIHWELVPLQCVGSKIYNLALSAPAIDLCIGRVNSLPFPTKRQGQPDGLHAVAVDAAHPGNSYAVGDLLTVVGGDVTSAATIRVMAIGSSGSIRLVRVVSRGLYDTPPVGAFTCTGGSGTGAQFDGIWGWAYALPIASMLLTGAAITPIRSAIGDRLYRMSYRFKYLAPPHAPTPTTNGYAPGGSPGNQGIYYQGLPAASTQPGYYEVTTAADGSTNFVAQAQGVSIYDFADMRTLFRVPADTVVLG